MHSMKIKNILLLCVTSVLAAVIGAGTVVLISRRIQGNFKVFYEAANIIENRYIGDADDDAMLESAIDGLISGVGDRWSHYYNPEEAADYEDYTANEFVGVGVKVTKADGEGLLIKSVMDGSGALEAGLAVGDTIVSADGVDLLPLTLTEASNYVGGEEDTTVLLEILHTDGSKQEIQVARKRIYETPVRAERIGNVGYVRLSNFETGAAEDFIAATQALIDGGAQSLVFDVRNNGGGYVKELTKILDYLLPEGDIFLFVDAEGKEDITTSDAQCVTLPMAVLANSNSISAAEYFAAMLQYSGYPVIGEKTIGKGYSQQTFRLSDGSCLVLSTRKYCLPDGTSLAGVGITPDYEVILSEEDEVLLYYEQLEKENDGQLQKALEAVKQ